MSKLVEDPPYYMSSVPGLVRMLSVDSSVAYIMNKLEDIRRVHGLPPSPFPVSTFYLKHAMQPAPVKNSEPSSATPGKRRARTYSHELIVDVFTRNSKK